MANVTIEQRVQWLEQGLNALSAAIRGMTGHVDTEHIEAMERAWEAGDLALTNLAAEHVRGGAS